MDAIFINHTNHAVQAWSPEQRRAAEKLGRIAELPFPQVQADWDEAMVAGLAVSMAAKIAAMQPGAVLCQGEFTYTYRLVELLKLSHIPVLAACSERRVREWTDAQGQTRKESVFQFVRFRRYV